MGFRDLPWILAVEPDEERAANLTTLVREWVDCDTRVVPSADAALAAMATTQPDLILLSSLISPADDARISVYLRSLPAAWDVPTLSVPPVVGVGLPSPTRRRGLLPFIRRQPAPWPSFDRAALGSRIRDAFDDSRATRGSRCPNTSVAPAPSLVAPRAELSAGVVSDATLAAHCGLGLKRLRDHRWTSQELAVFTGVRLPWGLDAQLLNISRSGLLLESGARLSVGEVRPFEIRGTQPLLVTGRIVRSHIAEADHAVRYQTAVHFQAPIELPDSARARTAPAHRRVATIDVPELDGLVAYVRDEAARGAAPDLVRAAFELGVQGLVTARDVRLVPASDVGDEDGGRTVRVSVPAPGGAETVLQAVFDDDRDAPRALGLLEAAAARAAEVLYVEAGFSRPLAM